jgi:hypothetical protein
MVGVAENYLGACLSDLSRCERLHGPVGGHRHENRCLDVAMSGADNAETSCTLCVFFEKGEFHKSVTPDPAKLGYMRKQNHFCLITQRMVSNAAF